MSKKYNQELKEQNYSLIGKISLQKYPILLQKDNLIKEVRKKHKIKDLFTPDEPKKNDKIEEYYSLFNTYQLRTKNNNNSQKKKKSKIEFACKLMKNNPKLNYHNKHLYSENKRQKLSIEADTFSYAPKYDFIRPRLLSGPSWKISKERKEEKINIDKRNYYINHIDFLNNPSSKCLVNMDKTTQRGEFINEINIRIRNEKSFEGKKKHNAEKNKNKNIYKSIPLFINISNKNKHKNIIPKTQRNKKNTSEIINSNDIFSKTCSHFNIHLKNNKNLLQENKTIIKKENNNNISIDNNSTNRNKNKTINSSVKKIKYNKNKAPDFTKIISREHIENIKEKKLHKIPFIIPNYTLVRERPLVMTIYKKTKIKNNNPKTKNIEGIDYKIEYNPDKYLTKYNNHTNIPGPNFNYMLSREYSAKKYALPSYMNNIHDRGSVYRITEKALKMNKFKEGKIPSAISSFVPKKSFNKIININMINSHDFKEKINDDYIIEKKEILKTEIDTKENY